MKRFRPLAHFSIQFNISHLVWIILVSPIIICDALFFISREAIVQIFVLFWQNICFHSQIYFVNSI